MVLVEVEVPGLRKSYDFRLEEYATVENIIDEICSVICQKEKAEVLTRTRDMVLSSTSKSIIMNNTFTLADYSIKDGMKLVLV